MLSYFGICSRLCLCAPQEQACTDGWNQRQGRAIITVFTGYNRNMLLEMSLFVCQRQTLYPHHWENSNDITRLKECWGRCG